MALYNRIRFLTMSAMCLNMADFRVLTIWAKIGQNACVVYVACLCEAHTPH